MERLTSSGCLCGQFLQLGNHSEGMLFRSKVPLKHHKIHSLQSERVRVAAATRTESERRKGEDPYRRDLWLGSIDNRRKCFTCP